MKIEHLTKEVLKKVEDKELKHFRARAVQVFEALDMKEDLAKKRNIFVKKYGYIVKEMQDRNLDFKWTSKLDKELFKSTVYGIDITNLKGNPLVKDFVCVIGDYLNDPKKHKGNIDILVKKLEDDLSTIQDSIQAKIIDEIGSNLSFYNNPGNETDYIGLYDLVLVPTKELERKKLETKKEVEKEKVSKTYQKFGCLKQSGDKGLVGGIVYRSVEDDATNDEINEIVDADNEFTTRVELEKACYNWMINYQRMYKQHDSSEGEQPVYVVESFITDVDTIKEGKTIPRNSWFLLAQVDLEKSEGKELWEDIKEGKITGWSMGGLMCTENS